eukprot:TRINITY_DN47497_c0_g1_i1.p1 TRINITY_DN47497_c0_g1~~TRINITY_DN47497_c0_g1_i1.p1  ORF type:complete len:481 (+),score=146.49 TRINITY_DN47497_c0_g1_i1:54-1496(+)
MKLEELKRSMKQPLQMYSKEAAAEVSARRARLSRRWRSDRSCFTALCIDVVPRCVTALPLREQRTGASTLSGEVARGQSFVKARCAMLSYRALAETSPPEELQTTYITEAEEVKALPSERRMSRQQSQEAEQKKFSRQQSEPVATNSFCGKFQRQMSAAVEPRTPQRGRQLSIELLPKSPNGYRPGAKKNPEEELKRTVQGLLNKICPENVASIVEKIGAVEVSDVQQLEVIIDLIFKKAVTEPHYCETYADLVFSLKAVYPSFESPQGGKPITFKGLVLNICQQEFEELLSCTDLAEAEKSDCDQEELEFIRKKRKDRMRANMKFIGHLFLRQLLSAKVIGTIICELVLCEQRDMLPEENALECACELLLAIGYTLENMAAGQAALTLACSRLKELKAKQNSDGKGAYCKRMQFMMQDVLDTRAAGWTKKVFKAAAKTREEIRLEQERELKSKASGKDLALAERVVTGVRPVYLLSMGA